MGTRLELHELLCSVLGTRNVYYQPPQNVMLQYPCIIYTLDNISVKNADNSMYKKDKRYSVTVIDKNPDSELPDKILELSLCQFDRRYVADNLYHTVFSIYY